jgi:hypothetical protein
MPNASMNRGMAITMIPQLICLDSLIIGGLLSCFGLSEMSHMIQQFYRRLRLKLYVINQMILLFFTEVLIIITESGHGLVDVFDRY